MISKKIKNLTLWFFKNLLNQKDIFHFVSSRSGGVSEGPFSSLNLSFEVEDDYEKVLLNRKLLSFSVGIPLKNFVFAKQIHKDKIKIITEKEKGKGSANPQNAIFGVDGMITTKPGICLTILVADCVPLLFFDKKKKIAGIVHAGWRGTFLQISRKMVRILKKKFKSSPLNILVGIGPSIGPCCYEVRGKVANKLERTFGREICKRRKNKKFFNLWEANKRQLIEEGIPEKNIEVSQICTFCHSQEFFSARKEKGKTGRFAAAIMIKF